MSIHGWRLRRARDVRDDLRHRASEWGWAWAPSQERQEGRRYDRANAKVVRLGGESKAWPRGADR